MKSDHAEITRRTFMRGIEERFFLRFHMSLILLATALSGVLSATILLHLKVENIVLRYPLAVVIAYLAFFLFVKLWLTYVAAQQPVKGLDSAGDLLPDLPVSGGSGPGSGGSAPAFSGGGGGSGGGGASGAFEAPATNAQAAVAPPAEASGPSSGLSSVGDKLTGLFDDDGIALIALAVLLAAIFGSAIYLVYIAPHILSEAAFDFLLGAGLVRSYRKMNRPDWMGSVFRDTYLPFLIVLAIAFCAASAIHVHDPGITRLSDVFRR